MVNFWSLTNPEPAAASKPWSMCRKVDFPRAAGTQGHPGQAIAYTNAYRGGAKSVGRQGSRLVAGDGVTVTNPLAYLASRRHLPPIAAYRPGVAAPDATPQAAHVGVGSSPPPLTGMGRSS